MIKSDESADVLVRMTAEQRDELKKLAFEAGISLNSYVLKRMGFGVPFDEQACFGQRLIDVESMTDAQRTKFLDRLYLKWDALRNQTASDGTDRRRLYKKTYIARKRYETAVNRIKQANRKRGKL